MRSFPLTLAIFLCGSQAQAAALAVPAAFCAPSAAIADNAAVCMNNELFAQYGRACVAKYDKFVVGVSTTLAASFSTNKDTVQTGDLAAANQDYQVGMDRLDYLLRVNDLALHELDGYLTQMVEPADPDNEDAVPCWQENQVAVVDVINDLRSKRNQVAAARVAAGANSDLASGREQNLDGTASARATGQGSGGGRVPAGQDSYHGSSVTGVVQDEAKQLKK